MKINKINYILPIGKNNDEITLFSVRYGSEDSHRGWRLMEGPGFQDITGTLLPDHQGSSNGFTLHLPASPFFILLGMGEWLHLCLGLWAVVSKLG